MEIDWLIMSVFKNPAGCDDCGEESVLIECYCPWLSKINPFVLMYTGKMVSQLFLRFYICWLSGEQSCPLDYLFYEDQSVSKILLVHAYQNYLQKLKSSSCTILVLTYIEENDSTYLFWTVNVYIRYTHFLQNGIFSFFFFSFRKYRMNTSIQALPAYADNSYRNPNRTLYNYMCRSIFNNSVGRQSDLIARSRVRISPGLWCCVLDQDTLYP